MLNVLRQSMVMKDRDLFDSIRPRQWKLIAAAMRTEPPTPEFSALFHSRWTECGERIRRGVADDLLLAGALRAWLPPYSGPAMPLYRGESAARVDAKRFGFCWTPQRHTAEMFASGWHAMHRGGGRLIRSIVPAEAILAAPNSHSQYLGEEEYTVDPRRLVAVEVLASYPRVG